MPKVPRRKGESLEQWNIRSAMHERKHGTLHSGSKTGPKVTSAAQAKAIGLSEARKAGAKIPAAKKAYKRADKAAHRRKRNIGRGG